MRGNRLLAVALSAIVVLVVVGGVTAAPTKPAAAPSVLKVAVPEEVPALDPQKRDNIWLRVATDSIYQSLLWRTPDGKLAPLLAESLPTQVNPRTWRFKIRKDIKFTNGEPLDALTVALAIARMVDPKYDSEWKSQIETIVGAKARGQYTVDVITKSVDVLLPSRMPIIKIVPRRASQGSSFASRPVGTGPYIWVSGSGLEPIVLRKNPNYWGTRLGLAAGSIQRVEIRGIPDVSTRISALKAGEVDLITVLPPDSARSVPKSITAAGIENPTIILNSTAGLTADVRVRQAMNYAVDKQALAKQLFRGFADPSRCQPVAPASIGYDKTLKPYAYDPTRARQLLQQAGATGKTVTLVSSDVFTKGRELVQIVAAFWEAVGLKVNVQIPEFNKYIDALYAKGAAHADAVYVSTSTDLLDGSAAARQLASDGIQSVYQNAKVDSLFAQAGRTADVDKRAALYEQLFRIACNDAALVNLLHPRDIYGASKRLQWTARFDGRVLFETMALKG